MNAAATKELAMQTKTTTWAVRITENGETVRDTLHTAPSEAAARQAAVRQAFGDFSGRSTVMPNGIVGGTLFRTVRGDILTVRFTVAASAVRFDGQTSSRAEARNVDAQGWR